MQRHYNCTCDGVSSGSRLTVRLRLLPVRNKTLQLAEMCACGALNRVADKLFDLTLCRYKGRFFPSHLTVKDLRIPAKDSRNVKVSVMKGAKQEKGPDPLGLRKGGGNSEEVGT